MEYSSRFSRPSGCRRLEARTTLRDIPQGRGERALLVWRDGRLAMERYRAGGSRGKPKTSTVSQKPFCALGTFAAISRNVLKLERARELDVDRMAK